MNLDALYSELTLKTGTKLALIVLDGVGDIATSQQGYLTPLEAANTPQLNRLSKDSAQGRLVPQRGRVPQERLDVLAHAAQALPVCYLRHPQWNIDCWDARG